MTTIRLAKYSDDDMRLQDADDAGFVRRKITPETVLDFSGIASVAPDFFDALLEGETAESIGDRLVGMNAQVDEAAAAWVDRANSPVSPIERSGERRRVQVTKPNTPPMRIERSIPDNDRFTPTRLIKRLSEALRGYIESAYPLSDPILVEARRRLLETEAGGHLLSQEPFIETTPRYVISEKGYGEIGLSAHIGDFFARLAETGSNCNSTDGKRPILHPNMYVHQEQAFSSFLARGKDIVVATGTGSGKTECFLVPMLGSLYDEGLSRPDSFERPAVRALILYPMNALVNDQLSRLRLLLGDLAVANEFSRLPTSRVPQFGMYTGRTPYPGPRQGGRDSGRVAPLLEYYLNLDPEVEQRLRELGRYPAKDLEAFYAKQEERGAKYKSGEKEGKDYTKHNWERRLHTSPNDRELLTRHEMVHGVGTRPGRSPDILVTNYTMLEYMLMRPFERPMFEETRQWLERDDAQLLLVLDEAHMYRGAKGAEVAFLLRRLRARLGIHDQPDKLRVIATSATLGSDATALPNICRFAADLTGKEPDDFQAISGKRFVPEPVATASSEETEMLASVKVDELGSARSNEALLSCLRPVLEFYGQSPDADDDGSLLSLLHGVLARQPMVNKLVLEAAGDAKALSDLASRVFPRHAKRQHALEALLALGTLARQNPESPGLVPTRVHGMFRGLHGLYACLNPHCPDRQAGAGQKATVGKLFTSPRATCDACGFRVFELASCRSCGTPYILAYAENGGLDSLEFLWGEIEGDLIRIQLLPVQPRYSDRTEELRVHLKTGYLDPGCSYSDDDVHSLYIWVDRKGGREPVFARCPMCQPSAPSKSRIYDFRTRGEQPFTALVEAQFAEQAPQKFHQGLPNHGRKVLVFSDGRQKAARLAPALEHSHARDLFRQVIALAAHQLNKEEGLSGMQWLYPGVVWLCAKRGYDLFPAADEIEFHEHVRRVNGKSLSEAIRLATRGGIRPTKSFAQALFSELTDRYYSLFSLALGTVEEDPEIECIFEDFPDVGLDEEAIRVLFRSWVRLHLERRSFRPDGAELRDLGEGWAGPVGITAARMNQVMPSRFDNFVLKVLSGNEDAASKIRDWFKDLLRKSEVLDFEGDLYFLRPLGLSLKLRLDSNWLRCVDCGRIHPESLEATCPGCCGKLVEAEPAYLEARTGYYRAQVFRAFDETSLEPFGLSTAEHSAQLTGRVDESAFNKVEEYELRFQDIALDGKSPIDVLSCTTTMEVGIDIGALSGVALRNVPPHVANYQQRAGRAGRRGRSIASVVTYAHGSSHDAHYFSHPSAIISGDVRAPVVYIENQQVLERHVNAYLVQRFFHERVPTDTGAAAFRLFESLGTVEQFLSETHECSMRRLESWMTANEGTLQGELHDWVPAFSHGLDERIPESEETIVRSVPRLLERLREVLPVEEFSRRDELEGLERETLQTRLDESLLQTLIGRAVFPRYAFPTDVVSFWVTRNRLPGEATGQRSFDYEPQRDLQLALTEYAPGRSLTIDKWRFESAAIFSPFEPTPSKTLSRRQAYSACRACNFVSLDEVTSSKSVCPCCGSDKITHTEFITPPGFAPDINTKREVDRGQPISYAGTADRARLELQDPPEEWHDETCDGRLRVWTGPRTLAVVNKGVGDRGFRVCPECGRSELEHGPGSTGASATLTKRGKPIQHRHPLERGVVCGGVARGPYYLGHRFPTDALLLRLNVQAPLRLGVPEAPRLLNRAARMALASLVEAMALAASRELQIDEGEISGWWAPVLGEQPNVAQLYLYDLLPGGAGYARAVGNSLECVLAATESLLDGCDCASSCYRCIRHYGNNWVHASLDRHLAFALLSHIRTGQVPALCDEAKAKALTGLREFLRLRKIATKDAVDASGVSVPMQFDGDSGKVWIDVHHPLVDPDIQPSDVAVTAREKGRNFIVLDAFALEHDLPEAVRQLGL